MLPFLEARARVCALAPPQSAERTSVYEALGRVLAVDVTATVALPRHAHSTTDGCAIRLGDLRTASSPYTLPVVGESRTGARALALAPGAAMRISTGAPIPEGADAVLMQEETTRSGDDVRFEKLPAIGRFIRKMGDDVAPGDVALPKGTRIGPSQLALLAALDLTWVSVARSPRVAILATGDELRTPGATPLPGSPFDDATSLPECIGVGVAAVVRAQGATARLLPIVGDDRAATERALDATFANHHDERRWAADAASTDVPFTSSARPPAPRTPQTKRGLPLGSLFAIREWVDAIASNSNRGGGGVGVRGGDAG